MREDSGLYTRLWGPLANMRLARLTEDLPLLAGGQIGGHFSGVFQLFEGVILGNWNLRCHAVEHPNGIV